MLIETFIRKQLRLKAHTVTKVEETDECMLVYIDRLGQAAVALRGLPAAMPGGARHAQSSGSGAICRCGSCH